LSLVEPLAGAVRLWVFLSEYGRCYQPCDRIPIHDGPRAAIFGAAGSVRIRLSVKKKLREQSRHKDKDFCLPQRCRHAGRSKGAISTEKSHRLRQSDRGDRGISRVGAVTKIFRPHEDHALV
jgi:hypothetical protein